MIKDVLSSMASTLCSIPI